MLSRAALTLAPSRRYIERVRGIAWLGRLARRSARSGYFLLTLLTIVVTTSFDTGCAGIINRDPNLRWWVFKTYGADRICREMTKTSVPLRLGGPDSAIVGRYFPTSCATSINEQYRTVVVNMGGDGYVYLPGTKRMAFTLTVAPEYAFDFYMHEDGNWVWGRLTRMAGAPDFKFKNSDNKILDIAAIVTPIGPAGNVFGNQIVGGFLTKGFTVVETSEGKEFSLGLLPPGKKPFKPIQVDSKASFTFANETVDVHSYQQDFLGPFEVASDDQQIQIRGNLVGRSSVDLIVVPKPVGDLWRLSYESGAGATRPPAPPIYASAVMPGAFMRKFKLKRGLYYVVVDNSRGVGSSAPIFSIPNPFYDPTVRLTYVAQLVDD